MKSRSPVQLSLSIFFGLLIGCGSDQSAADVDNAFAFVERIRTDPEYIDEIVTQYYLIYEDEVGFCMKASGFEYLGEPSAETNDEFDEDKGFEHYRRYGLGISTQAFPQEELPEDLTGHNRPPDTGTGIGTPTDDSYSEAYRRALEGPPGEGCEGLAAQIVVDRSPDLENLLLLEEVDNDESIGAATRAEIERVVTECVNLLGYEYPDIGSAAERFADLTSDLKRAHSNGDLEFEKLRQLQDEEQSVALAYWECGFYPANHTQEIEELYEEYWRHKAEAMASRFNAE